MNISILSQLFYSRFQYQLVYPQTSQTVYRVVNYKSNALATKNMIDTEEVFQKIVLVITDDVCRVIVTEYKLAGDFFNEEAPDSEVNLIRKFVFTRNERSSLVVDILQMEGSGPVFEKKEFQFKQKLVELGNIFKRIEDRQICEERAQWILNEFRSEMWKIYDSSLVDALDKAEKMERIKKYLDPEEKSASGSRNFSM